MPANTLTNVAWRNDIASYEIRFPDYTLGHAATKEGVNNAVKEWSQYHRRIATIYWIEKESDA